MKKIAQTKLFIARFVPKQIISPIAYRYLTAKRNPIRPKVEHLCNGRDPNTLWWRVSTSEINHYKRVVRSWAARKARAAFAQELKARGFDAEGRRLDPDSTPVDGICGNMTGSLNIMLTPACREGNYTEFCEDMKTTMNGLIQELQKMQTAQKKVSKPVQPKVKRERPMKRRAEGFQS